MRDTVHCLTVDEPDQEAITRSVLAMIAEVQQYVPGYTLKNGPVFDGKRVSIYMEVEGLGIFLPKYAGNLDIMTAAGCAPRSCTPGKYSPGILYRTRPENGTAVSCRDSELRNGELKLWILKAEKSPSTICACATACTPSGTRSP